MGRISCLFNKGKRRPCLKDNVAAATVREAAVPRPSDDHDAGALAVGDAEVGVARAAALLGAPDIGVGGAVYLGRRLIGPGRTECRD